MVEGIFIDCTRITSIAGATCLTVYDSLSVQTNWGWGLKIVQDVESVSKG